LPKALTNPPEIWPWLRLFYDAFIELVGDRNWEYGPITWHARTLWAQAHALDPVATELLHIHVKALDLAFLKWKSDTQKSKGDAEREQQNNGKPA
jgi:hypothetical protein